MGSVRKHGRGFQLIWQVAGQRHWETVLAPNKNAALRELKKREGQAAEGRLPDPEAQRLRFEAMADAYVTDYKLAGRKDEKHLQARMAHLKSYFAGRLVSNIHASDIREYAAKRQSTEPPAPL